MWVHFSNHSPSWYCHGVSRCVHHVCICQHFTCLTWYMTLFPGCGRLLLKQLFFSYLLWTHMTASSLEAPPEIHPSFLTPGSIQHMCIQCCRINHVIEHNNWPAVCSCADSVPLHHLVHHMHAALCGVERVTVSFWWFYQSEPHSAAAENEDDVSFGCVLCQQWLKTPNKWD